MRIVHVTSTLVRAAAGLREVVADLSRAQQEAGEMEVSVLGLDHPDWPAESAGWSGAPAQVVPVRGPRTLGYAPELAGMLEALKPDVVHLHGLWTHPSRDVSRWSGRNHRPRIIAPHGMLDPWALRNSAWKKRIVATLYENRNLRGAACLHALNVAECQAIRAYGLDGPIAVVPNGIDTTLADVTHERPDWAQALPTGARVLLFLGRIHPKKGLSELVQALALLSAEARGDWHLIVAGWDQLGYGQQVRDRVERLGLANCVHFIGPQFGKDKAATLAQAEMFILPSFSEGLPMTVLEAWAFRLPVLMTPACNLPEGFAAGAALSIATAPEAMAETLQNALTTAPQSLRAMGLAGRQLVDHQFTWQKVSDQIGAVYAWCANQGPRPENVHAL